MSDINIYFYDIMNMRKSLPNRIMARIRRMGRGKVHATKDFLDLGARSAVDQVLVRLVKRGLIKRFSRGLYFLPRVNRMLGMSLAPGIEDVVQAIARKTGSRAVVSRAAAANQLGFSTQIPARSVFLTDGKTKQVRVGNHLVTLKHTAPKNLPSGDSVSTTVFQALRFLGPGGIDDASIARVRNILTQKQRKNLMHDARYASGWLADAARAVCRPDFIHG
ncbi:MAG: hypothetical protein COB53_09115 [Elusimicrobia bacterium]|nr:MAG: hypothetical protein COB53_09115 [Elusimicrobiota bacterium]